MRNCMYVHHFRHCLFKPKRIIDLKQIVVKKNKNINTHRDLSIDTLRKEVKKFHSVSFDVHNTGKFEISL